LITPEPFSFPLGSREGFGFENELCSVAHKKQTNTQASSQASKKANKQTNSQINKKSNQTDR